MHTNLWWGNSREKVHVEDLGVDGRKILNACSRNKIRAWIDLVRERHKYRFLVNALMSRRVIENEKFFSR